MKAIPSGTAVDVKRDALGNAETLAVEFGAVSYLDHHDDRLPVKGPLLYDEPFFRKEKSFEHEREFRAVITDLPIRNNGVDFNETVFPNAGVAVPVDLDTLVEEIVISPNAPSWFRDTVAHVLTVLNVTKSAGLSATPRFAIRSSQLDRPPIF
jgi:hypothetical protein